MRTTISVNREVLPGRTCKETEELLWSELLSLVAKTWARQTAAPSIVWLCVDTRSLEGLSWVTSCQLVFPGRHQAKIKDNEGWVRADLENELTVAIRGRRRGMDS